MGKGYRFIGPVRVIRPLSGADENIQGTGRLAWQSGRSSLAVLPLRLHGDVKDDNGLCLGFADALVSRLANLEGVDVLPTSSILSVPTSVTASDVASRLGVRFVVHGAIQASKATSHLSVELFDSHSRTSCFIRKFVLDVNRPFEHIDADRYTYRPDIEASASRTKFPESCPLQPGSDGICRIHSGLPSEFHRRS